MIKTHLYNLHLKIMFKIFVAYNCLVFFLVLEHCEIEFIVENGVIEKEIIMFDEGYALKNHEIS